MPHMLPPSERSQVHTVLTAPIAGGSAPSRAPSGTFADAGAEPLDWERVRAALSRWKWLIAGIVLLGLLGGVAATRFIDPTYVAQATVWIDARARTEQPSPTPFQAARLLDPEAWTDLMRSYAVLDDVARSQRLFLKVDPSAPTPLVNTLAITDSFVPGKYRLVELGDSAGYRLEDARGIEIDEAPLGAPIGEVIGLSWTPPARQLGAGVALPFELISLRDASASIAKNLQLNIDREGNLMRLELEGTEREALAPRLNAVAERFVAVAGDLKRQKVSQLTEILAAQLRTATADLNRAEAAYQQFRTRTITLPNERLVADETVDIGGDPSMAPVVGQYLGLQNSYASVRRDREAIERALRGRGARGISVEALNAIDVARTSPILAPALNELTTQEVQLRQLRLRYTTEHPEVVALTERVETLRTHTIPTLAEELVDELRAQESRSGREVAASAASLRQVPARSLEEARLRRSVTLAEALHNTLQQRHEEAQMATATAIPDARILDRAAIPQHPTRDTTVKLMVLALALSIVIAIALALLLDHIDPKFRYPTQVLRELRLPILGALPHVRPSSRNGTDRPPADSDALVEAMRGLRMALLNDAGGDPSLVVAISSPGSGDGKSFVASNLARSFAAAGFNTLLVDGDLRRGRLHQRFSRDRRPGLCDLLQETVDLDSVIQPTGVTGLSLISCGSRLHQAPELLGGQPIVSALDALRDRFEVIICDTPPLTAGIDPYLLSVAAGKLLLVLRAGVSHREMMVAKLAVLDRMPIHLLGVVMNDVTLRDAYGYYSYHLSGYETHDERVPATAVTVQA